MRISIVLGLLCLAASLRAQTPRNVQLLGTFSPTEACSGVWGYEDPASGAEVALLLAASGTYVLECTTGTPVQRAYFPGPASGWREAKTVGPYAYVVTEGGGGMQVIDLRNPANPVLVGTHTVPGWTNTHTLAVDEDNGTLWACGTNLGMLVLDAGANPLAPVHVATFAPSNFYVHDAHVHEGWAHLCDIFANRYHIADVSNLQAMTVVGTQTAPGRRFFHNVWATRDNAYAVGTNETAGGPLSIWDVRVKSLPFVVHHIHPAPATASIHNAVLRDRVVHVSYYTEGYVAVDLSVPAQPTVVGNYDTYPGASSGFNGAWGVFPFLSSGKVFVSDVQSGLWVLQPAASVVRYGSPTAGGSGRRPLVFGFGAPTLGNAAFAIECERAAPLAPGALLLNALSANLNVVGLQVNVDPFAGSPVLLPIATDGSGKAAVPLPVPVSTFLAGRSLYAQFLVYDAGGPFDLSASRGLEFRPFAP